MTEAIEPLLLSARQGDTEALSALYRRFVPGIFGYIATRVPDRATAEDLTSEVFLQMVEGIHRLKAEDEARFVAWLLRIARVTVAGYYRKRARHPLLVSLPSNGAEDLADAALYPLEYRPESDPAAWTETREEWQTVVQAINQLTEEQRQVLVGRLIMGYDVETVARLLGKKANAIKALQFRALQRLHRLVGRPYPAMGSRHRQKEDIE